jgi:ATP adenylyltransferase/5',5'''-P-1,P-4-tetraphosphate phosphorylase II
MGDPLWLPSNQNTKMNFNNDKYRNFLLKQNQTWKQSADNYSGLDLVEEKMFDFIVTKIKVQFNPARMRSSSAKVDQSSIAARKCFLCPENRPEGQFSLDFGNDFLLLVNPFPIFQTHFTIPSVHHIDQRLIPNLQAMFKMAQQMEGYTLFYNGPECGASAPDHLHFQAGEQGFLPVEEEFDLMKKVTGVLLETDHLKIWAFDSYLRKMISFETDNLKIGIHAIENVYLRFSEIQSEKMEPMINMLCYFNEDKWRIHLFPRKLHRPRQFFEHGTDQLLISPASVDFGGVFITPRREDFDKITASDITDIFSQISLDDESFHELKKTISNYKVHLIN